MLTEQEQKLLDITADFWNEYLFLEPYNDSDRSEMLLKIHDIQNAIMCRPVHKDLNEKGFNRC